MMNGLKGGSMDSEAWMRVGRKEAYLRVQSALLCMAQDGQYDTDTLKEAGRLIKVMFKLEDVPSVQA